MDYVVALNLMTSVLIGERREDTECKVEGQVKTNTVTKSYAATSQEHLEP